MLRCVTAAGNQHRAPPNGVQFRPLPRYATARFTTHAAHRYVRVLVFCNSCRHQADADRYALVESGRGDVPLTELPFRCSQCGSDRTDFVVTSLDRFCHVSRLLPLVARPESSDYAICMMPIAMRACWRK